MSYGLITEMYTLLPQVTVSAANDALLGEMLSRATDIVDMALGFSYASYSAAAAKDVRAVGGQYLELPAYELGSVTAVYAVSGKGTLSEGTDAVTEYDALDDGRLYANGGWGADTWYRVTAEWGYGTPPDSIVQVTLEVAVNLWRGKDRGLYSDVIGVEGGGAVGYQRALTNQQRMIIAGARNRALGGPVIA
jgi:hypothetical protein